ncbi:complement C1q-like protein 4 [Gigantopelta aegis]|uniref:complement C1q-like protein 4 n=1 Tax=Gigantopelta aegis TaxID=1735272 RepID=UPI001B88D01B|nr:complement C1q-like protein 4 [Gigantopelta aegis]
MYGIILYTVMSVILWMNMDCASTLIVTDDHFTELETNIQALKQKTSALEDTNTVLRQEIIELKRKIPVLQGKHRPVVFTAQFSQASVDNIAQRDTLRFDNVRINLGNGYNPGSGVFRAPLSGVYQFLLQTVSKPRQFLALEILRQGVVVSEAFTYQGVDSDWGDIGFCAVILSLDIGDDVYIRNRLDNGGLYGLHWTQFSGVLLSS